MIKRLLLFALTCILFISCSDDPSSFTDEPPELPPAASMDIDMSTLTESPQSKSSITTDDTDYFVQAVFRAGFMKKIIEAHLLIPKNLLEAAQDTVAQLNEEQQWEGVTSTQRIPITLTYDLLPSAFPLLLLTGPSL